MTPNPAYLPNLPNLAAAEREAWRIYRAALEGLNAEGNPLPTGREAWDSARAAALAQWQRCAHDLNLLRAEGVTHGR